MPPLQSGFAGLYKLLGLPVIPIAVNSGVLCPKDSVIRHSGVMTYKIGEEIPPGLPREEIEALYAKVTTGPVTAGEAELFRGHMLTEMARMAMACGRTGVGWCFSRRWG